MIGGGTTDGSPDGSTIGLAQSASTIWGTERIERSEWRPPRQFVGPKREHFRSNPACWDPLEQQRFSGQSIWRVVPVLLVIGKVVDLIRV